ncbi:hypothetical protein, partial [Planococcus sp. CAU13]|uniref:hypothetical protein n=1 Tax=Planococcus sp. CAU13 TaxID=1541197 RepID=UPI001F3E66A6
VYSQLSRFYSQLANLRSQQQAEVPISAVTSAAPLRLLVIFQNMDEELEINEESVMPFYFIVCERPAFRLPANE